MTQKTFELKDGRKITIDYGFGSTIIYERELNQSFTDLRKSIVELMQVSEMINAKSDEVNSEEFSEKTNKLSLNTFDGLAYWTFACYLFYCKKNNIESSYNVYNFYEFVEEITVLPIVKLFISTLGQEFKEAVNKVEEQEEEQKKSINLS